MIVKISTRFFLLSVLLIPTIVQAQNADNKDKDLQEVVVTAGRIAESKSQVPGSVYVINSKQLSTLAGINTDISQVLGLAVPGLGLSTNTTNNRGQSLRGRNILVMIDGIPQSTPLRPGSRDIRTIDVSAIERIEVIKGATSIYGNGADGGIINIITKKAAADEKLHYSAGIAMATQPLHAGETWSPRITQSLGGNTGKASYFVAGSYEHTGVMKDAKGTPLAPFNGLSQMENINILAKTQISFTENSQLSVMYNFYHSVQNTSYITQAGEYGVKPAIGVPGQDSIHPGTPYNHNAYIKYNVASLGNSGTSLEIAAIWQRFKTIYDYTTPQPSQLLSNKQGLRLTLQTPFHLGKANNNILTYGIDVLNDKTSQPTLSNITWVPRMNMLNGAPYVQAHIRLKQHWIFKAGARYEFISIRVPDYYTLPAKAGAVTKKINGGTISDNLPTFNAGIRFARWELFAPFISFSQGYSLADLGRSLRTTTNTAIISSTDIKPAISNNYEIGFNSHYGPLSFQFACYMSRSKRGIFLSEDPETGILYPERAPEHIYGWEAEIGYQPSKKISINASYAFTEGKIKEEGSTEWSYLGNDRISPAKLNIFVTYTPVSKLAVSIQGLYSSTRNRFDATKPIKNSSGAITGYSWYTNEGPVSDFFLANLSARYSFSEKFKCGIGVENLLNRDYYTPLSQFSADNRSYVKGNGMRMTVSVQYELSRLRNQK